MRWDDAAAEATFANHSDNKNIVMRFMRVLSLPSSWAL
jgi:hypothetical protein